MLLNMAKQVNVIESLYSTITIVMDTGKGATSEILINQELRQGFSMSPILCNVYNVYIDDFVR